MPVFCENELFRKREGGRGIETRKGCFSVVFFKGMEGEIGLLYAELLSPTSECFNPPLAAPSREENGRNK